MSQVNLPPAEVEEESAAVLLCLDTVGISVH